MARLARFTRLAVGRVRALRGRCPACNSEGAALRACSICHGHVGPFPVAAETRARWMARLERAGLDAAPILARPLAAAPLAAHRS